MATNLASRQRLVAFSTHRYFVEGLLGRDSMSNISQDCTERNRLAEEIVKANKALHEIQALREAVLAEDPYSQQFATLVVSARSAEKRAIKLFDRHLFDHGCGMVRSES